MSNHINHRYIFVLTNDLEGYEKAKTTEDLHELDLFYCKVIIRGPPDYDPSNYWPEFNFPSEYVSIDEYTYLDPIENDDEDPHLWFFEAGSICSSPFHIANKEKGYVILDNEDKLYC